MNTTGNLKIITKYPLWIDWSIHNYFNLPQRADTYFQSPPFEFEESMWCLQLYPNGERRFNSVGAVDLHLVKMSSNKVHHLSFSMGIKNGNDTIFESILCTDYFDVCEDNYEEEIIKRSDLLRLRQTIAPYNILTVFIKDLVLHNKSTRDESVQTELLKSDTFPAENEKKHTISDTEEKGQASTEVLGKKNQQISDNEGDTFPAKNEKKHAISDAEEKSQASTKVPGKKHQQISDNEGIETLLKDFKDLFLNQEDCDVTLKVENQEFRAHRSILVARSPVFASMFRHNMSEKNSGIVNIADCCPEAFKELLLYLYTGDTDNLSPHIAYDLYEASVKYDLEYLKKMCVKFLLTEMSADTFCDILTISLKYDDCELVTSATDFFAGHLIDILPTVRWQSFLKENPISANELYLKAAQKK